jgi:hypothetical protein
MSSWFKSEAGRRKKGKTGNERRKKIQRMGKKKEKKRREKTKESKCVIGVSLFPSYGRC